MEGRAMKYRHCKLSKKGEVLNRILWLLAMFPFSQLNECAGVEGYLI